MSLWYLILLVGPFVMNSQEEIQLAMIDYQTGKNGFQNAKKWRSSAVGD